MKKTTLILLRLFLLAIMGLSACSPAVMVTVTPVDQFVIETAAVGTYIAEITASAPTETPIPPPTETLFPTQTPEPTWTPEPTITPTATLLDGAYYKALDSNEASQLLPDYIAFYLVFPIDLENCSYYMRPVMTQPFLPRTGDVATDVTTALNLLFRFSLPNLGVFENPLLPADHKVVSITVNGGSMAVYLTGGAARTDDPCTNHQMRDQIFTTIRQIAKDFGIYDIVPYLDTMLYDDYMIGE